MFIPPATLSGNAIMWGTDEINDGKYHIVAFRQTSATTINITVDDIAPRTQTVGATDVRATRQVAGLGTAPLNQTGMFIDLSMAEEVIVHDPTGVVADGDVASLRAYFKQKYAL